MRKFISIFISLVLVTFFLSSCGDSEEEETRELVIESILNDDSFNYSREEAECYVDTVAEAGSISFAELESLNDDSNSAEDMSPELFAAILGSFAVCGIELDWDIDNSGENSEPSSYDGELIEKTDAERNNITVLSLGESHTLTDSWSSNGVKVTVSNIEVHPDWDGEQYSRAFNVEVRAENATNEDLTAPEIQSHCADDGKFDDSGSWYAGSTYDMYDNLPAGTYTEGTLALGYPEVDIFPEFEYSDCEVIWVVLYDGDPKVAWVAPEIPAP